MQLQLIFYDQLLLNGSNGFFVSASPTYLATFSIFVLGSLTTPISKKSKNALCSYNRNM